MLDLSFLLPGGGKEARPEQDDPALAYQRYLDEQRVLNPGGMVMSRDDFERYSLTPNWLAGVKDAAKKVVQTCRLMVGVHDYEYYLEHMRSRHPGAEPLSRDAFYRYCLDARFPGAGNVNKCPC